MLGGPGPGAYGPAVALRRPGGLGRAGLGTPPGGREEPGACAALGAAGFDGTGQALAMAPVRLGAALLPAAFTPLRRCLRTWAWVLPAIPLWK